MNTNEIVKALREIKVGCSKCLRENYTDCGADCSDRYILTAADEIERLQKELDAANEDIRRVLRDEMDCCQICKFDGQCKPDIICHCSEAEWRGAESEVSEC